MSNISPKTWRLVLSYRHPISDDLHKAYITVHCVMFQGLCVCVCACVHVGMHKSVFVCVCPGVCGALHKLASVHLPSALGPLSLTVAYCIVSFPSEEVGTGKHFTTSGTAWPCLCGAFIGFKPPSVSTVLSTPRSALFSSLAIPHDSPLLLPPFVLCNKEKIVYLCVCMRVCVGVCVRA